MISPKIIADKFKIEPAISSTMETYLSLWFDMYTNKQKVDEDNNTIHSLNLPYAISSEKARLAMLELKTSVFDPSVEGDDTELDEAEDEGTRSYFLNQQYQKLIQDFRHRITPGIAVGTCALKAVPNLEENTFDFDVILGNEFFPISFNSSGKLTHAVFVEQIQKKDNTYTRLETHELKSGTITVTNEVFKSAGTSTSSTDLGTRITLTDVVEWENLEPKVSIRSSNSVQLDRLLVTMFTMPESNNIDVHSKLGMSAFEPARTLIDEVDKIYSDFLWEFEGGALAIDAPRDAIRERRETYMENGETKTRVISTVPKRQKRLFREVNLSNSTGDDLYSPYNPTFRDSAYQNAMNIILMSIEDKVALARGTFSQVQAEARTATEIKTLKQRTYQSNHDLQQRLQIVLEDLVWTMDIYASLYSMTPEGEYKTRFEWDDSILVDISEELRQKVTLMSQGAMFPEEVAAWYSGVTLEHRFKEVAQYKELQAKYTPEVLIPEDSQTNIE